LNVADNLAQHSCFLVSHDLCAGPTLFFFVVSTDLGQWLQFESKIASKHDRVCNGHHGYHDTKEFQYVNAGEPLFVSEIFVS
jgi:hypothetical protein